MAKIPVERCYVVTTKDVKRAFDRGPGVYTRTSWKRAASPVPFELWHGTEPYCGGLALMFLHRTVSDGPQFYRVRIEYTKTPYGHRVWFLCPEKGCEKLCSKLYMPFSGDTFACRHCWDLSYESRQVQNAKFFRTMRTLTAVGREQEKPTLTRTKWMKLERQRLQLKEELGSKETWPRPGGRLLEQATTLLNADAPSS